MVLLEQPLQFEQLIRVLVTTKSEKAFYQEQPIESGGSHNIVEKWTWRCVELNYLVFVLIDVNILL